MRDKAVVNSASVQKSQLVDVLVFDTITQIDHFKQIGQQVLSFAQCSTQGEFSLTSLRISW